MTQLEIDERVLHIEQMIANRDRKRQEVRLAPWQIIIAAASAGTGFMAAGAALFAAGGAYVKYFIH